MTKVYLVRHGEAEGNLYRRAQGQYDGRITTLGLQQIECLAERFRDVPLQAVYTSDLSRAMRTAEGVARFHPELAPQTDLRLREICMGIWEEQPWGNIEHDSPEQLYYFNNEPGKWSVPGAESFAALCVRLREAVIDLAARHDGQTIAIASHGMAIRTLLWDILEREGRTDTPGHGDNTSVSLLEVEGENIHAVYLNDVSHLPQKLSTFARQNWWKHEGCGELNNMRLLPMRLQEEEALYLRCYADAWRFAHGSLLGFVPEAYLQHAKRHCEEHPLALMKAIRGEEFAGLIELDTARSADRDIGWISLLYMTKAMRGKNLAVQLLGHAVSVYRHLGRKFIRLHVSVENLKAILFYKKYGFVVLDKEEGVASPLYLMEKAI